MSRRFRHTVARLQAIQSRQFIAFGLSALTLVAIGLFSRQPAALAACAPSPNYGSDTLTVNVPTTGTYYIWTRLMSPDTTNNQIMLSVDSGTCFTLGATMPANTWTWVDTQSGTSTRIALLLTGGSHSFVFTGNQPGMGLDEVQLLADASCTPQGTTNNCMTTPGGPSIDITSLAPDTYVHGDAEAVNTAATASSGVMISKCELTINNDASPHETLSSAPYNFTFNTLTYPNGPITIAVGCSDNQNNRNAQTVTVYVNNGDLNGDGKVNISDLAILAAHYGLHDQQYGDGNITGQTAINISDLSVLAANWGWSKQ